MGAEEDVVEVDHAAISLRQSRKLRSESMDIFFSEMEEMADDDESGDGGESKSTQSGTRKKRLTPAELNVLQKSAPFYKFVLTGGPCGGKTTALARLSVYLRERGFEVFTVPEAFTILASNGFGMEYFAVEGMPTCVQNTVMDMQISLEDSFERVVRANGKKAVLLCDRGLCDGAAYMKSDDWDNFLVQRNITSAEIREGRYNAVFHLVTAAEGAENFYTLENNEARTESPEQARALDQLTRGAWVGHPKLFVIDNSTDFEGKLNKLVSYVSESVGLPTPSTNRKVKKYLLKCIPDTNSFPSDLNYKLFDVEKVYLYDIEEEEGANKKYAEEYSFIRKRTGLSTIDGRRLGSSYGLTTVQIMDNGQQVEVKRIISQREYAAAYKTRDMARNIVKQTRITFLWHTQSFTIHIYKEPEHVKDLCLCHVQTSGANSGGDDTKGDNNEVDMPDFLNVERVLTDCKEDNQRFGAFNISLVDS